MRPLHALGYLPLLTLLFTPAVYGEEDKYYDPALNYRPENVAGLDYYYYPWKARIYYNGTVTFTISHIAPRPDYNYDDEPLCARLSDNYTYTFSYPGILGVTQTEGGDERPENKNEINVILSTSRSNFTAHFNDYNDSGNMQVTDEVWVFESVDVSRPAFGYEKTDPNMNLTVSETSGVDDTLFRVHGTTNADEISIPAFEINMSSCARTEAWWGADFASEDWDDEGMGVVNPTLRLTFDAHSANFALQGFIFAYAWGEEEDEEETLPIVARVAVEFLGRHDDARSDILDEGTPVSWTPTVGFGNNSLNLDYEGGSGIVYWELRVGWVWGGLVLVSGYLLL
ncbi:hypothetical protein BDV12DRAFT_183836 [Aspergillus spectabilis]